MKIKKTRGGQPANLNACKRPWEAFWKRRALRKQDRWVLGALNGYVAGLMDDKPHPSHAEQRMMELSMTARAATLLILKELTETGFVQTVNGAPDLVPAGKDLVRFLSAERQCLQTLGLEKRGKAPRSLNELLTTAKTVEEEST